MPKGLDLTGKKLNMLTVLCRSEKQLDGNVRWDCICDCGNITSVTGSRISLGKTKSCGCLAKTNSAMNEGKTLHGMSRTSVYRAWMDAKSRCLDVEHRQYEYYGGRGIRMQESWVNDFPAFYDYIGDKPTPLHSLDRIDNDLDYCEGNVRWATKLEQVANRGMSKSNKTGVTGVYLVVNPENGFEHYKARWGPKGNLTNKSFSVEKYGKEGAFELAVKAHLEGLEELKRKSVYTEKHGEERKNK